MYTAFDTLLCCHEKAILGSKASVQNLSSKLTALRVFSSIKNMTQTLMYTSCKSLFIIYKTVVNYPEAIYLVHFIIITESF